MNTRLAPTAFLLLALFALPAIAQKAPELGYVYPAGGRAGTTVEVQLGGFDFTPDMQFFVHDPRVKLTVLGRLGDFLVPEPPYWFGPKGRTTAFPIPREIAARIEIPSDMPPGPVRWQVANANGTSATGVFLISDEKEVVENRFRSEPQLLDELPVTVSGRLGRITEVDRYRIRTKKAGPITIELMARKLGSKFHGMLQVHDSVGRIIADVADTEGLDTSLTFAAEASQQYEVRLTDVDFRGNRAFVYRLRVTPGPRVVSTIPAAINRGANKEVKVIGYGVATGASKLETVTRTIDVPVDFAGNQLAYRLETAFGSAPLFKLPVSGLTEKLESDLGNRTLTDGIAVTGTLDLAEDRYEFAATKGETWIITAQSQAIGTRLDLSLRILDIDKKQVATGDDSAGSLDAELTFVVPKEGVYSLILADMSGRHGSLDAIYRIVARKPAPDFLLTAAQQVSVPIGGKGQLSVKAVRLGGHKAAISIQIKGLPEGVKVPSDLKIPAGKNDLKIAIEVAADAASCAAMLRVSGEAKLGDQTITRVATATAAGNLCPASSVETQVTGVLLAITMKPPFSVELIDKNRQRAVHRGTTYPAEFVIKRNDGFTGDVLLQMASKQGRHRQGIRGPILTVPGPIGRTLYPCFMPEWLETDRTTRMVIMGVAQVKDPKGNQRFLTKIADARITMILEGALLKVSHAARELTVQPGQSFEVPIIVVRSVKLAEPVRIELVVPPELTGVFSAEPIILAKNGDQTTLRINSIEDFRQQGDFDITIKATALQDGKWPAISETKVPVRLATADH